MHYSDQIFFLSISLICFLSAFLKIKKYKEMQTWPNVTGTINESTVRVAKSNDGSVGLINPFLTIFPEVFYEYIHREQNYTNSSISINSLSFSNLKKAESFIERYPIGENIQVYYDPSKPERSYLDITAKPKVTKRVVASIISFLIFLIMFF